MRRLIVGAFVSLDGVMQAPGGPDEDPTGGFGYGGWVAPHFDETLGRAVDAMMAEPFALLLGRRTYDIFAAHWPHAAPDDPIGALFNRIDKHVATRNPDLKLDWTNSRPLRGDAAEAVRRLKAEDGPALLTQGSTELLETLFANDLVDQLDLFVMPVVLGRGKRLFADTAAPTALRLESSTTSPAGVIIARYARAGAVPTGSFAMEPPTEAEITRRRDLE